MQTFVYQGHLNDQKEPETYPLRLTPERAQQDCQQHSKDPIIWGEVQISSSGSKIWHGHTEYLSFRVTENVVGDE